MRLTKRALLAGLLATATPAVASAPIYVPDTDPGLSPRGQGLVRELKSAIKAEQGRQAGLPAAASDDERLVRMAQLEQLARETLYGLDLEALDFDERRAVLNAAWSLVEAIDRRNQAALWRMLPAAGGWFGFSVHGEEAGRAAWLIAIHAVNDRRLMREAARRMAPLAETGEVQPAWYAALFDRLAVLEGRPQRYGTQPVCRAGAWVIGEVEDPAGLDTRRMELGLQAETVRDFRPPPGC